MCYINDETISTHNTHNPTPLGMSALHSLNRAVDFAKATFVLQAASVMYNLKKKTPIHAAFAIPSLGALSHSSLRDRSVIYHHLSS